MESVAPGEARRRRRAGTEVRETLRELGGQLSRLNHHVGGRVALRDSDLDCLDLIVRAGPMSPSALARRTGLHPATVTGVLDRLQRGGWVVRERDPAAPDRRAVAVRALPDRVGEVYRLYGGMNDEMDRICADYDAAELDLIAGFLRRTVEAGRTAGEELAKET